MDSNAINPSSESSPQQDHSDNGTGIGDLSEWPTLQRSDTNLWVSHLQQKLHQRGYQVAVCGLFGPVTEVAVRSFQHINHLPVTGIVDSAMWAILIRN